MDNGPHEDSSRCDCGDGENCSLLHIWQSQDKDLSTTIDNAGTMGLMRTAHDVTVVMERTAHYFIFGKMVDAFQELLHDTEQYLNSYFNKISSQIMFVNNVLTS